MVQYSVLLRSVGIVGEAIHWNNSQFFLPDGFPKVIINGQSSLWAVVKTRGMQSFPFEPRHILCLH